MDRAALIVISIAGLLGFYMLWFFFKKVNIPKGLSILHGITMLAGYLLLLTYNLTTSNEHKHWQSFSIFTVAILLGLWATWSDIIHKSYYRKFICAHFIIGIAGIIVLYLHVLGGM